MPEFHPLLLENQMPSHMANNATGGWLQAAIIFKITERKAYIEGKVVACSVSFKTPKQKEK